jgi:hypothetical protein
MSNWRVTPKRHDSHKRVSGIPGAVHGVKGQDLLEDVTTAERQMSYSRLVRKEANTPSRDH